MRKRTVLYMLLLLFLCDAAIIFPADKVKIGILRQLEIPPFLKQSEGAKKALADNGFTKDKVEFIEVSANGNMDTIKNIVNDMKKNNIKLFIPIGTSASIEVLKLVNDIPVVACVTYEESLNESKAKFNFGNNYTAALMFVPSLPVIEIALKIKSIKTVGMMYNENEDNARKEVAMLTWDCKKLNLKTKTFPYNNENAIIETFKKMLDSGIDCIVIPKDTLLAKHLPEIKSLVHSKKMLVVALDDAPTDGDAAIISLTAGNEDIGMLLGKKAAEILNGKKPADIPMDALHKFYITVNLKTAKATGINIPVDIIKSADRIIKEQ